MGIRIIIKNTAVLLVAILLGNSCNKQPAICSKMGYEFTYSKPGTTYSPGIDSIPLGNQIIIEASAPKSFFDEGKQYNVTLHESAILGPLGIQKLTNDPITPRIGAIEDVDLIALEGSLLKDTIQFSQEQLKGFRTTYWISKSDSFKLKVIVKPKIKGTFIIILNQQGNRDKECALYKYFLNVINTNQHLYFLEPLYGYIPVDNRAYCFKVY